MEKQLLEPTLVQKAYLTVDGFDKVFIRLLQQVTLRGQSKSTLNNYISRIAAICMHFGKLPQEISDDELTEYLTSLAISPKSPSRSNFKHMVYELRYYFRLIGDNKRAIDLPSLKRYPPAGNPQPGRVTPTFQSTCFAQTPDRALAHLFGLTQKSGSD